MKILKSIIFLVIISFIIISCKKETPEGEFKPNVDYFTVNTKPKAQWNELDFLCDSIQKEYGVKIIYEYTPQTVAGTTFFTPADYKKALAYTRIVLKGFWLKPLKEKFPLYFSKETPIEFIISGGFISFNDITVNGAAGAGLNAQFYRLGMGGVNNFDKTNKTWLFDHIVTLYHEHAHQQDHKYGRGFDFDRVSVGTYYGTPAYASKTLAQANADGFTEPYGGFAPEEDFATTVGYIAKSTKAQVDVLLTKSPKLVTKYRMVDNFYRAKGMDLYELHNVLDSVVYRTIY